jgi:hypothetical protein
MPYMVVHRALRAWWSWRYHIGSCLHAAETLLDKGRAGAGCVEIEPATEDALAFLARAVAHNLDKLHQSVTSR